MIMGLILLGSFFGAISAATMLILGQPFWMACLVYIGSGCLGVLGGATIVVLRATICERTRPLVLSQPQSD